MLHPTAIIAPTAQLAPDVKVGPHAVIEDYVTLGPGCVVGPFVHLLGHTTFGAQNCIHAGAVIGDTPQDLKYQGEPTRLIIGNNNVFREHVTVHRSNKLAEDTIIGSHNFLMANSHVGHNARLGNHVILANGALLAGHVEVGDRAFISGNCLVHQFTRVGALALMQGGAAISQDLPPFCIATGDNGICGLNTIGLRRNGFSPEQRLELRHFYHLFFLSDRPWRDVVAEAQTTAHGDAAMQMVNFIAASKRGVCRHVGSRNVEE